MIDLSKVYKKKTKNVLKHKKGKISVKPHSEVSQKSCLSLYLSTFISHLIIDICRLDILFKKHFYFLSVNSNFKPPSS